MMSIFYLYRKNVDQTNNGESVCHYLLVNYLNFLFSFFFPILKLMKFVNFSFHYCGMESKEQLLSSKGFLKSRVWKKFRILIYWHATLRRGGPLAAKGNYESTSVAYWISIVRQELKEILVPFLPSECMHKVPVQHFRRHIFL